jgi:Lysylphosphatidylglycerol synthase TM region
VPVSRGLVHTALLGLAGFVLYAICGVILLRTERPLAATGRAAQSLWNRVSRGRRPLTGLDKRLLAERDTIRTVLGQKWWQAVLLTAGRVGFDYGCLLCALRATGADPQPSLVLLAYAAAGIVALFPVTPGGLGIVEASLSGLLILAGTRPAWSSLVMMTVEASRPRPVTTSFRLPSGRTAIHAGPAREVAGNPLPTGGLTQYDVATLLEQTRDVICSAPVVSRLRSQGQARGAAATGDQAKKVRRLTAPPK